MRNQILKLIDVSLTLKAGKTRGNKILSILSALPEKKNIKEKLILDTINMEVKSGEFISIIGKNGAGKTSLLRILSGIYKPNSGQVVGNPSRTPLIEFGGVLEPELSVTENIYLFGILLGVNIRKIRSLVSSILEWAELDKDANVQVRNLSTGMTARLGFAIATSFPADILLVDEVLSVGDIHFAEKAMKRVSELNSNGTAILLVTHDLGLVLSQSKRCIWIENGRIKDSGRPSRIVEKYKGKQA